MPINPGQAKAIFFDALEKSGPERATFLDAACGGDPALRRRVERMLLAHEASGELLERPPAEMLAEAGTLTGAEGECPAACGGEELQAFLAPPTRPDSLGRLGHYHVQEVVGRGGFGIVLKAFDEKLHRVVAIKVLAPELAVSATARQRFIREARAAAAVSHEHVVAIHAIEEEHRPPYLVMQFVDGLSLQDKLNRHGALGLREILRIGYQTACGLAAAHKQGLVHRDIKPANILLENGVERVKITDFGLARATDDASVSQSGAVAGTPMFMSPEQANGDPVDHRSDLFSLGSVLYVMATGRPPFRASSTMAVMKRVIDETPTPVRQVNADIPDWLAAIIAKLHAKKPADRFQSAEEVADLLGQHLAHVQQPSPPPVATLPMPAPLAPVMAAWRTAVWYVNEGVIGVLFVISLGLIAAATGWLTGEPTGWIVAETVADIMKIVGLCMLGVGGIIVVYGVLRARHRYPPENPAPVQQPPRMPPALVATPAADRPEPARPVADPFLWRGLSEADCRRADAVIAPTVAPGLSCLYQSILVGLAAGAAVGFGLALTDPTALPGGDSDEVLLLGPLQGGVLGAFLGALVGLARWVLLLRIAWEVRNGLRDRSGVRNSRPAMTPGARRFAWGLVLPIAAGILVVLVGVGMRWFRGGNVVAPVRPPDATVLVDPATDPEVEVSIARILNGTIQMPRHLRPGAALSLPAGYYQVTVYGGAHQLMDHVEVLQAGQSRRVNANGNRHLFLHVDLKEGQSVTVTVAFGFKQAPAAPP
jgi:hypothetical protein